MNKYYYTNTIKNYLKKTNMSQFTIPTLSAEMNRQLFYCFGEELIKRIAKFAATRDPDEDTSDNAIEWSMNILEEMFNRDDTVKIVKRLLQLLLILKNQLQFKTLMTKMKLLKMNNRLRLIKQKRKT